MNDILLVNYEYPPIGAGAANATYHTARALVKTGLHPVVVTASFDRNHGVTEEKGVTIIRLPARRQHAKKSNLLEMASFMACLIINLPSVYKHHQIHHAIIYFSFPCGPIGLLLRSFYKTRYIVSLRGGDVAGTEPRLKQLYWLLTPLRRLVLRQSEAVIANSTGLAELSMKADPYPVQVIANGVDTDYWKPEVHRVDKRTFDILFVGRFHEQKNLHFLIDEFAQFHKSNPDARLLLVGDGPDIKLLKQQARANHIGDYIRWYNWASPDDLRDHYRAADCLVNPSHYEGLPNVVLEAMACGTPVIASNTVGNSDLIQHGKTGLLFEADNSSEFQSRLEFVRDGGKEIDDIVQCARETMISEYTWEAVGRQYLDYFPDHIKIKPEETDH